MNDIAVTLIQTSLHWENIDENLNMFDEKIDSVNENIDLIVLPEMFTTGFTMNAARLAEEMNGKTMQWMKNKASEKQCCIAGSIIIRENILFYNRLIWFFPDGHFQFYDKHHLFRMANEDRIYNAGKNKTVIELKGWKFCPMICYDLRFPVWSRNKVNGSKDNKSPAPLEFDVLLYAANWPEIRSYAWKQLLIARSMENQCYTIGLNRIGEDGNGKKYSGDSAVINPNGYIISDILPHSNTTETIILTYTALAEARKNFPAWMDADSFTLQTDADNEKF